MSEAFLRAMQFHGLAFFAPLLAMLEANLEPFATYTPRAASVVSDKELKAAKDEAKDIVVFY
ncbi:hypothetical protein MHBO_000154 [Bonamia ostreae]|uniref:Uncharacterized protein n=1 Tax=Bonamia ostreae TaxID=126728 RepID=A0ABV2AEK1_9EUKA